MSGMLKVNNKVLCELTVGAIREQPDKSHEYWIAISSTETDKGMWLDDVDVERYIKNRECEVKITGHNNAIGCEVGECKCGEMVRSLFNYCPWCGTKLGW